MAWVSVHQEVDGPKLRKLAKSLDISKAEALGILNFLWFWGMNNVDETGMILEADREDVKDALTRVARVDAKAIVDALFQVGWLDDVDGRIYIHDWDTWQEQWYKLKKSRQYDAERKRKDRSQNKRQELSKPSETADPTASKINAPDPDAAGSNELAASEEAKAQKVTAKQKERPPKKKFAEFVSLTDEEHQKLIDRFGAEAAEKMIEKLNVFKGSKGKQYKSDYMAILNWVVDWLRK